jgi:cytoskeletal protein CcmA (bactofilin family)
VLAAGANVSVDAPVGNDLWAAGESVAVNAPVADNIMLAGNSVLVDRAAKIGGNARVVGNEVNINGPVSRDLYIAAAAARIASEVTGNVEVHADKLVIDPGAVIRGRLTVHSPNEPVVSPEAQVLGGTDHIRTESSRSPSFGSWVGNWLLRFLWLAVLGLILIWFSSVWTERVTDVLRRETGRSFLTGLAVLILAPIVCILLLVTVVGLPLGVILGAVSVVALMLSGVFVSYFVGEWLTTVLKRWETSHLAKVLLGALVVSFVIMVPWIGGLAKLVVVIFGLGAFLIERRDLFKQMRAQGLA